MSNYFKILAADFATKAFLLLNFYRLPTQFIFGNSFTIRFINLTNDFINPILFNAFAKFNCL